jgi:hypothetical protein
LWKSNAYFEYFVGSSERGWVTSRHRKSANLEAPDVCNGTRLAPWPLRSVGDSQAAAAPPEIVSGGSGGKRQKPSLSVGLLLLLRGKQQLTNYQQRRQSLIGARKATHRF